MLSWQIVTGEYSPTCGGVADYTRALARALAAAGDDVHVWAPTFGASLSADPGVQLHPLPDGYGPTGLRALVQGLKRQPRSSRLLIQYVPHAFGMRGVNLPFCTTIAAIREREVWVMFHEVALPWAPIPRWKANAAALATRAMANVLVARADRVLISIPLWEDILRKVAPLWRGCATWLPIPSNIPLSVASSAREEVRASLKLTSNVEVVGHFGGYGPLISPFLTRALRELLEGHSARVALLVGRGSETFVQGIEPPGLRKRMIGTGELGPYEVATHLGACDVLIQPYPDGISSRRTSAMAGLALGVPTVTNHGVTTEPLWHDEGAVVLAASPDAIAAAAQMVLGSPTLAKSVGERGRDLYIRRFALEGIVKRLREAGLGVEATW